MLSCDDITLSRGNRLLFQNLSFSLLPGCLLQIIGPNGIGKTSLLRVIARFITSHHGKIKYDDINVDSNIEQYRYDLCYIGVDSLVDQELTVKDQINLWSYLFNSQGAITAAINTLSLHDVLNSLIANLSSGYKQRVKLSLLILTYAKVWLLDEPFNFLDQKTSDILINMMESKISQNGIVIYTNHREQNISNANIFDLRDFIS